MRLDKMIVFGLACMIVCFSNVGCQKKADQGAAERQAASQVQTNDQQVAEDGVNVSSHPSTVAGDERGSAAFAEVNQATSQQKEMASSGDEPAGDEEQVSFGRMVGGVFRAARSLVPVPAAGSSDAPKEPSGEAPSFPQQ